MSLVTPLKVVKLQQALHVKAKEEPEFRFYQLYDKVYRWDVLVHAYRLCRANVGAAGVDGLSFDKIESKGLRNLPATSAGGVGRFSGTHHWTVLRQENGKCLHRHVSVEAEYPADDGAH